LSRWSRPLSFIKIIYIGEIYGEDEIRITVKELGILKGSFRGFREWDINSSEADMTGTG